MSIKDTPLVMPQNILPGQVTDVNPWNIQGYITASKSAEMQAELKEMLKQRILEGAGAKEEVVGKINPNEYPPLKMRLSELEGLWEIKFGENWVSSQELMETEDSEFWDVAALRLKSAQKVEKFSNHESFNTYYRLCR